MSDGRVSDANEPVPVKEEGGVSELKRAREDAGDVPSEARQQQLPQSEDESVKKHKAEVVEESAAPAAVAAVSVAPFPSAPAGVLSFLAIVPDAGRLGKAKRAVSSDRWAFSQWQLILEWASRDNVVPVAHKRIFYKGVLEIFPTAGAVWRDLAGMEIARGKQELAEQYFSSSLLVCQYVPLWLTYLSYITKKPHTSAISAREEAITAFEFALTHIGIDPESGPIWEAYVSYLKEMPCSNPFEESSRMTTIRKVYQRAITMPLEALESIWRAYQRWEQTMDAKLANELTQKLASVYTDARVAYRERSGYTKGIRRAQFAVPPTEQGDMVQQVMLWKRLILYEKSDQATLEKDYGLYLKRVRFTFDACLVVLRFYPEIWIDYAETVYSILSKQNSVQQQQQLQQMQTAQYVHAQPSLVNAPAPPQAPLQPEQIVESVRHIWTQALEVMPSSVLLHLKYSLFLETCGRVQEAAAVFDVILGREAFTASDKQLALVHQLLFVRRTKGMLEARKFSVKALPSSNSSWQLFATAAKIELFMNREPTPARKVFEFGMKQFGKHVPFLLQYIETLYCMNEESNMRVMFDTFMKDEDLRKSRELWDEYFRFELTYGSLASIESVAKRRAEALGNAVDPNGIFATILRFKVMDLFPVSPSEIRAMSLGVSVVLKQTGRSALVKSLGGGVAEKGNPLHVLFRDPEYLKDLPRPALAGEESGLTPLTRDMAVGAALPGDTGASAVPSCLLDLIELLPAPHEYNGPTVSVDAYMDILRMLELPTEVEFEGDNANGSSTSSSNNSQQAAGSSQQPAAQQSSQQVQPGALQNAPASSDIFRIRQMLKSKTK